MHTQLISPVQWPRVKKQIVKFVIRYGERHITQSGIQWLKQLTDSQLSNEGTLVLVALEEKRLLGVLGVRHYGLEESLIVVSPANRQKNIGKEMVQEVVQILGKVYGKVATDNLASLKMCFASGLLAFDAVTGPTGKPTLWVAAGDWDRREIDG